MLINHPDIVGSKEKAIFVLDFTFTLTLILLTLLAAVAVKRCPVANKPSQGASA